LGGRESTKGNLWVPPKQDEKREKLFCLKFCLGVVSSKRLTTCWDSKNTTTALLAQRFERLTKF
jgi:hypothetical protein